MMSGGSGSRKISSSSTIPGQTSPAGRESDNKTDDLVSYYVDDFMNHFKCDEFLVKLKRKALEGELRSCRFRSIAWKLFLDCLPENPEEWLKASRALREEYNQIINKYDNDPYKENGPHLPGNNPLSQDDDSSWNKYFQDTELKAVINQDVVRTFPEIDFFQDKKMQNMLCTILFHFARENPRISYRQGMHELLAPILFIVHSDQQALLHAKELNLLNSLDENISQEIEEILSPHYLEHDTFFMFRQVMETVEAWYSHETISFKMDSINFEPFSNSLEPSACSVLGIKLRLIYDRILKRFDNELHHHLSEMQIEPQVFGIRWLRLLFGREFSLQDLLVVWDAIFSDGISFSLCDYIFASMLIVIRKLLLNANYSQAMGHLMRYPNVPDTQYIIHLALHLRDPLNFSKPDGYSMNIIPADVAPSTIHLILPDFEKQASINQSNKVSHVAHKVSEPPVLRAQEAIEVKRANRPKSLPIIQASAPPLTTPTPTPTAKNGLTTPRADNLSSSIASTLSRLTSKKAPQEMQPMPKVIEQDSNELDYCIELLSSQIDILQKTLAEEELKNNDLIFLSLAKLKIARDILKGTLKYNEFS